MLTYRGKAWHCLSMCNNVLHTETVERISSSCTPRAEPPIRDTLDETDEFGWEEPCLSYVLVSIKMLTKQWASL